MKKVILALLLLGISASQVFATTSDRTLVVISPEPEGELIITEKKDSSLFQLYFDFHEGNFVLNCQIEVDSDNMEDIVFSKHHTYCGGDGSVLEDPFSFSLEYLELDTVVISMVESKIEYEITYKKIIPQEYMDVTIIRNKFIDIIYKKEVCMAEEQYQK